MPKPTIEEVFTNWTRSQGGDWDSKELRLDTTGFIHKEVTGGVQGGGCWEGAEAEEFYADERYFEEPSWPGLERLIDLVAPSGRPEILERCAGQAKQEWARGDGDYYGNYNEYRVSVISFEVVGEELARGFKAAPKKWMKKILGSADREIRVLGAQLSDHYSASRSRN